MATLRDVGAAPPGPSAAGSSHLHADDDDDDEEDERDRAQNLFVGGERR